MYAADRPSDACERCVARGIPCGPKIFLKDLFAQGNPLEGTETQVSHSLEIGNGNAATVVDSENANSNTLSTSGQMSLGVQFANSISASQVDQTSNGGFHSSSFAMQGYDFGGVMNWSTGLLPTDPIFESTHATATESRPEIGFIDDWLNLEEE